MILTRTFRADDRGSELQFLVELRGFEPLTPSMRTRCATGLRYSPKNGCQRSKSSGLFAPPVSPACLRDRRASVSYGSFGSVGVLVVDLVPHPA